MAAALNSSFWRSAVRYLFGLALLASCHSSPPDRLKTTTRPPSKSVFQLVDFFADSLTVGRPRQHKLTIAQYRAPDSMYVAINFYARRLGGWQLRSHFHFRKDYLTGLNPKLVDYNHDGFSDFTYQPEAAARSSNKLQRLFLYQPQHDQLLFVKNSEQYPNLLYNKQLRCLDAFLVHGGCTTFFLRISADTLRPFASVELSDSLVVRTYSRWGVGRLLLRKPLNPTVFHFTRYKNYHPLQAYTDADF